MQREIVNIPYVYHAHGVRKRARNDSWHRVEGSIAVDVAVLDETDLDTRLFVETGGKKFDVPVWNGMTLMPLSFRHQTYSQGNYNHTFHRVPRKRMASMAGKWLVGATQFTKEGFFWSVPPSPMTTRFDSFKESLSDSLVGTGKDLFRELTWSDEDEVRAKASQDAMKLVIFEDVFMTGMFEPTLSFDEQKFDWIPTDPSPDQFNTRPFVGNPVRLDKAVDAIAKGVHSFRGSQVQGDLDKVIWKSRDADLCASIILRECFEKIIRTPSSYGNDAVGALKMSQLPVSASRLGSVAACLADAAGIFEGRIDPGPAVAAALRLVEEIEQDAARYPNGEVEFDKTALLACASRLATIEKVMPDRMTPDEAALFTGI